MTTVTVSPKYQVVIPQDARGIDTTVSRDPDRT
jgi:hypothetical protein